MSLLKTALRSVAKVSCRLYPFYSGSLRLSSSPLLLNLAMGDGGPATIRLKCGAKIRIRFNDLMGVVLYYFGDLDPKISWLCRRLLRPGDTFLDVGANYGSVSMIGALVVGPSGRVCTFEPQPDLSELIRSSCELNNFRQVEVHSVALSSSDGLMEMSMPADNSGAASLRYRFDAGRMIQVEVRKTDDYFESLGLGPVRLMKLDVEGHESEFIKGGEVFFRERGPDAIIFESNEMETPFWERPPVMLLGSFGYELYSIPKARLKMSLDRVTPDQHPTAHDYLAVRADRRESVMDALGLTIGHGRG